MKLLEEIGKVLEKNRKKLVTKCTFDSYSIILKKTFNNEINDTVILYKKNVIIYISKNLDNLSINFQIN